MAVLFEATCGMFSPVKAGIVRSGVSRRHGARMRFWSRDGREALASHDQSLVQIYWREDLIRNSDDLFPLRVELGRGEREGGGEGYLGRC